MQTQVCPLTFTNPSTTSKTDLYHCREKHSILVLNLLLFYLFSCCSSENFAFFTQAEEAPKGRGKKFLFSGTDRIFLGAHTAAVSNSRVETFCPL